jgi:hypothetical protein
VALEHGHCVSLRVKLCLRQLSVTQDAQGFNRRGWFGRRTGSSQRPAVPPDSAPQRPPWPPTVPAAPPASCNPHVSASQTPPASQGGVTAAHGEYPHTPAATDTPRYPSRRKPCSEPRSPRCKPQLHTQTYTCIPPKQWPSLRPHAAAGYNPAVHLGPRDIPGPHMGETVYLLSPVGTAVPLALPSARAGEAATSSAEHAPPTARAGLMRCSVARRDRMPCLLGRCGHPPGRTLMSFGFPAAPPLRSSERLKANGRC